MSNTVQETKKKVPMRRCLGCNESVPKAQLIRVVRAPVKEGDEGNTHEIFLDFKGKASGRGAYICKNLSCLKKARKSKRIDRNLDCTISDEIYNELEAVLKEGGNEKQ